jgi:tetratricopeptide (TPR) repeat protein
MSDLLAKGKLAAKKGLYQMAIELFKKVIKEDANNIEAYVLIAEIYFNKGLYSKAIKVLKDAEKIKKDGSIFIMYSKIYMAVGLTEEALKSIKKALSLDKENPAAYFCLGEILKAKGLYEKAITTYEYAGVLFIQREKFEDAILAFENADESRERLRNLYRLTGA